MTGYRITEPHPSVPKSSYIYAGRGGAGNISRVNPANLTEAATASGPASRISIPQHQPEALFSGGRGGAGNIHRERERAIFSFDEELQRQQRMMEHQAPIYHVGRGGAGNTVDELHPRSRQGSSASTSSADSHKARKSIDHAMERISRAFSRQ